MSVSAKQAEHSHRKRKVITKCVAAFTQRAAGPSSARRSKLRSAQGEECTRKSQQSSDFHQLQMLTQGCKIMSRDGKAKVFLSAQSQHGFFFHLILICRVGATEERKQKQVHPQIKFDLLLHRFAFASPVIHFQRKDAHFPQSTVEMCG